MMRSFFVSLGFILAWLAPTLAGAASPDVTLNDVYGKPHHFSEYIGRGHWTVLVVWGPRCPPCIEEMPELQGFHDDHEKGKARVLGIAVDFPTFGQARRDEVAQFADDHLITFPLLLGNAEAFTRFGGADLQGMPTTLIYDRKGAIVVRHTGSITRDMIERFITKWDAEAAQ
ncbi:MAG: TlpA family protein disulfide reductase [Burkholderiales bacterium]|nr:TlpA family protein disulfide reductase [Burkholderiales bacterium]